MPRLVHYSKHPLSAIYSREQTSSEEAPGMKSVGLWFSVEEEGRDDGWAEWCRDNDFHGDCLEHKTEVLLRPASYILRMSTGEEIDAFTSKYGVKEYAGCIHMIDWRRVASEFSGIVIAPYIYSRRLSLTSSWYYGWDCASGCVWDAAAVERVVPLGVSV